MMAAVVERFGPHWRIAARKRDKPAPAASEILVRVRAATVNRTDCGELRHPLIDRAITRQPQRRVLGLDFAGEIEAVGDEVGGFAPGDRVFGLASRGRDGGQAQYVCLPSDAAMAILPSNIPFAGAPVCEGAYYAQASVAAYRYTAASRVMVYGASGAIGTAAVQLLKQTGAQLTAVVPGQHLGLARDLGADRAIDYRSAEFAALGAEFDVVLDAVGKLAPRRWRKLVKPDGRFFVTDLGPRWANAPFLLRSALSGDGKASVPLPRRGTARAFVQSMARMLADGRFRAVVDRGYPLDRIADAYRYVETGQKVGIVTIDTD